jgi:hypothetical protein
MAVSTDKLLEWPLASSHYLVKDVYRTLVTNKHIELV